MTRTELFERFPRPWTKDDGNPGVILDARGTEVLVVDSQRDRPDEEVDELAGLLLALGNEAPV